jgi:hypothetical protein
MALDRLLRRKRRRTHASTRVAGGLAGIAAGIGLMYFLEPRGGPRRRSQLARRAERALHEVEGSVEAGARDLSHRARGLAHEAKARARGEDVSDEVLAERVRAKLGRLTAHPRAIEVAVRDGRVELSGPVFRAEHHQVLRGVRWVRGVRGIDDRLRPSDGADVAALQGAGPLRSARAAPLRSAFGPGAKLLAGAAGAALAARALLGRGMVRILAGVAGAAILGKTIGDNGPARRGARRLARTAAVLAHRASEERAEREEHRGAWHPGPEVREVKSPAELEPGVVSASPKPAFPSRVDRGERAPSSGGGRDWKAAGDEARAARAGAGSEDVSPRGTYVAPTAGSEVRESDLGTVGSATEGDREAERADEGATRRDPTHDG